VEDLRQDGQAIYRVRIGPEAERAAAESLRDRVERDFRLKGVVMRSP
jgi:cell division septation protein DedD